MSRHQQTLSPTYFDALYADDHDPWNFETSNYEREKYRTTIGALISPRYGFALEIGCSIGVLTEQLAPRCDHLLSIDIAAPALERARSRCAALTNVTFRQAFVPDGWPSGTFDLIVLSEVLYYFDRNDLCRLIDMALGSIARKGTILLVHWRGETNYPLGGDEAAESFVAVAVRHGLSVRTDWHEAYRLDLLSAN